MSCEEDTSRHLQELFIPVCDNGATGCDADVTGSQADVTGSQADVTGTHDDAMGRIADSAEIWTSVEGLVTMFVLKYCEESVFKISLVSTRNCERLGK